MNGSGNRHVTKMAGALWARASISQDYWGDMKQDWGSGRRKSPSGVQGQSPGRESGGRSPTEAEDFCETTHNICIKIQQTTVVAVTG